MTRWLGAKCGKWRHWKEWLKCPCCRSFGKKKKLYKKQRNRKIRRENKRGLTAPLG